LAATSTADAAALLAADVLGMLVTTLPDVSLMVLEVVEAAALFKPSFSNMVLKILILIPFAH